MAQLKQLSAGSSQIIMMMFRDKNNAPIKIIPNSAGRVS